MKKTVDEAENPAEPWIYKIPEAGRMVGLSDSASYAAAARGQIPTMDVGRFKRVPGKLWRTMISEGTIPPARATGKSYDARNFDKLEKRKK